MEEGYGGGQRGDALGCRRRHAVARKTIGRGDDESHRKSVTGGLGLDESETTDGSCEWGCGLRRGARGTGEIRRSVMVRSRHGGDGLNAGLRFECAE